MRRTSPIAWILLTLLFLAAEPLEAHAQRGRAGGSSSGVSSSGSGVSSSSSQRGSSRGSTGSSRGSVGSSRGSIGSSRGSVGSSRGSVGSSIGRPSAGSSGVTRVTRTATPRTTTPTVRYVTPDTTRPTSTDGLSSGLGTRGSGTVVVPTREVAPPPISAPPEPAPSSVRRGTVLPEPVAREVIAPVRTLPRAPVPEPYRPSRAVERPLDPAALRAVDRYRESVASGEWSRVRDRLADDSGLRSTTTRNLDRLIDRYERGVAESPTRGAADADGRPRGAYRFDYGRGPLDRLARPNAEREVARDGSAAGRRADGGEQDLTLARMRQAKAEGGTAVARRRLAEIDGASGGRRSLLDSPRALERLLPTERRGGREPLAADAPGRRALDGLATLSRTDPAAARRLADAGRGLADIHRGTAGLVTRATLGAGAAGLVERNLGAVPPGYQDDPVPYWDGCYWDPGLYGGFYCGPWGFGLGFGCSPFWFNCGPYLWNPFWCNYPGAWSWYAWGFPFGYGWCPPLAYTSSLWWAGYGGWGGFGGGTTVIVEQPPVVIVEQAPAPAVLADPGLGLAPPSGTVVVPAAGAAPAARPDAATPVSGAADTYLTLGDRAFREGRYADAVHFYAKAVELEPEVGVFSLVLSDALFATGDYGYAAFALRRAFELEPQLVENEVDKRSFYTDPREFDRQLATLELYLEDHPADDEARLVLAANLLFSGAPAAAVDQLESPLADGLDADQAAGLVLARALELQYGR